MPVLSQLKRSVRAAALKRWAPDMYSPNATPAPVHRLLNGRRNLHCMDIGAFNGDFFAELQEIAHFEKAVLVEPMPELAASLRRRFQDHTVVEAAVGSDEREVQFNTYPDAPYTSSVLRMSSVVPEHSAITNGNCQIITAKQRTLDSIAYEYDVHRLDLLKIDIQGAELSALSGARSVLATTGAVWIEVSFVRLYEGSCLFHEVHDMLYSIGFRMTTLRPGWGTPSGELIQADALFQR